MLSYMPTIKSTDNKGRLKYGSARASSSTGLFNYLIVGAEVFFRLIVLVDICQQFLL